MNQSKPKQKRNLEVRVSFEVSRLSPTYLTSAYEQILPAARRVTSTAKQSSPIDLTSEKQLIGEPHDESS